MSNVLVAKGLSKSYREGLIETNVFANVDFTLQAGEKVAIVGSSGSGKSTLLHVLAGLDVPDSGVVTIQDSPFSTESEAKRGQIRNAEMGFVYQFHHLLPELTALENVMLPLRIRRVNANEAKRKALDLLARVGLSERVSHKPSELSGGERQRVALARALITEPKCLLADEPTGNLDYQSAEQVFQLLLELNTEHQTALLVVTHDLTLAAKMDRKLHLIDGALQDTPL